MILPGRVSSRIEAVARAIEITFPERSGLHRVRNVAEELSLSLGDLGVLPMDQADAATTIVVISEIPARRMSRCRQLIERLLKKHLMTAEATVRTTTSAAIQTAKIKSGQ